MEVVDTHRPLVLQGIYKKIVMDGWFVYHKRMTAYLPAICDGEGATPIDFFLIKGPLPEKSGIQKLDFFLLL
jgi:hypothetical protein